MARTIAEKGVKNNLLTLILKNKCGFRKLAVMGVGRDLSCDVMKISIPNQLLR